MLTATPGSWAGTTPIAYTYQWESCDPSGLACLPIANAINLSYGLTTADVGTTISFLVTASNAAGSARAASAPTAVVQPASTPPANTSPPTIVGAAEAGQSLTAAPGGWSGTQPIDYAYQWQVCDSTGSNCNPIAGATTPTYSVTADDVGTTIRVLVAAANTAGSTSAVSASTAGVQAAPDPPASTAPPTISGAAQQGKTLVASPGGWSGTPPISYAYQWQRCGSSGNDCAPITGARATAYTLTSSDVGKTLKVKVTASNVAGSANAASAATAIVVTAAVVALWRMDETGGSTMVDAVGGHNGTLHNVQLGLPGFSGTSYGFNGSSSYADVPSTATLNPGSFNITITIHVKTTGAPPPAPSDWDVFRKGLYTDGAEYKMEFQSTGQASCGFEGTGGYAELVAGPAINDGHWHTVSCVKTSTAIEVVVDGTVYSKAATVGSIANTTDVTIGARPGSDWYSGQLDEASIQIG